MPVTLFGFEILGTKEEELQKRIINPNEIKEKTFAIPQNDDGAVTIQSGSYYGVYVDLDGVIRNEVELITRYREMSMQPELELAIEDIVNEAIVMDDESVPVEINLDDLKQSDALKDKIRKEFEYILKLLNFGNMGHEIFKRWYVDGRLFYHNIIDETDTTGGIKEVRYIDPRRIRKIREVQKVKDPKTGIDLINQQHEYYLYNERGMLGAHANIGAKIAVDSIININSGLMDAKRTMVLSYLHKAIKPLNNLRMMEDATVIYRLSRAPERRIFYIDVGNMPTIKAEQYIRDIMVKYRNKLVYDSATGEIKDDRKHLSMLEDIWLPRREGNKGTEIETLPGGQNLGQMEDVKYFEQKLYKALGIPISRLEQQTGFSLGRTTEITRDELKFNKFIQKLRNKFSELFDNLLRVQLVLKKVCSEEEWNSIKDEIWYDYRKDVNFAELKEAELHINRFTLMQMVDPFVGRYVSKEWAQKNVLHFDDDEISQIEKQMKKETAEQQAMMQDNVEQGLMPDGTPMPPAPMPGMPGAPGAAGGAPGQPQLQPGPQPGTFMDQNGQMTDEQGQPLPVLPSKFETRGKEVEFGQ